MKNDHKIIVKCRWAYGSAVSSVVGSWLRPDESSRGKAENFGLFTSAGQISILNRINLVS